jgi:hypothetical protein
MSEKSNYQRYRDENLRYYDTANNPLRYPPFATKTEVAEQLARLVALQIGDDAEPLDQHRMRLAVVNTEMLHARLAPGDFNEDSEQAMAYEMGIGIVVGELPQPRPDQSDVE